MVGDVLLIYTKRGSWMILTCYNFEFFKPEDLYLFAVSVPHLKSNFVHFALKIYLVATDQI